VRYPGEPPVTGWPPSSISPPRAEPAAASCSTCDGSTSTSTRRRSPSAARPPWSGASGSTE
jgi:hypothetical protein